MTTINDLSWATIPVFDKFQHSYIPQENLSNLATQFVSHFFDELNQLPEIKISHASLERSQTI